MNKKKVLIESLMLALPLLLAVLWEVQQLTASLDVPSIFIE